MVVLLLFEVVLNDLVLVDVGKVDSFSVGSKEKLI